MTDVRQLLICCDGTNNTLTGRRRDTNVLRLYEHVRRTGHGDQLLYYDPGVGSADTLPVTGPGDWLARKWDRVSGLAVGRGAFENIGEAYACLMRHWTPGTQVWIFGFSRGAFTARSVSGMVNLFGVLAPEHEALLPTLLRVYFSPTRQAAPLARRLARQTAAQVFLGLEKEAGALHSREEVAEQVRDTFGRPADVHFVGVWDTVEAIGMPGMQLRITSASTIRSKRILHARQALALDEHRLSFAPRLYGEDDFGDPGEERSLRQRWFRGVHADVGGGYAPAESGLSDEALAWMLNEAHACGLRVEPLPPAQAQDLARGLQHDPAAPVATLHDPLHTVPWWAMTGMAVRGTSGPPAPHEHASVAARGDDLPSVWGQPRAWPPLLLALLGGIVFLVVQGWLLAGRLLPVPEAMAAAVQLGVAPLQSLGALVQWKWPALPDRADQEVAAALLADFGFVLSYGYLLGAWSSRAFTRLAGLRRIGDPVPAWNILGRALPLLLVGDVLENLLLLASRPAWEGLAGLLVGLAGVASAAKFAGLLACAALLLAGLLGPTRAPRKPDSPPSASQASG